MERFEFDPVEELIAAIGRGEMVIIADDENRENEGDLVVAAAHATPAAINFMATHARGLICVPLDEARARELQLHTPASLSDPFGTAFTQSVDARGVTTTGISAYDRAATVAALIDPASSPGSFTSPGHLFPLIARPGGVLRRTGHTEAAVDLARLACFCNCAGTLAIRHKGAIGMALPTRVQVEELMDSGVCPVTTARLDELS